MSQGYIGYHLQKGILNELIRNNLDIRVASIVTQVEVDENDPAFKDPTKPIGRFYTEEEANELAEKFGYVMKEDAGRGYRRFVPSPRPKDIVEKKEILGFIENKGIVIASGGGGIPVIKNEKGLHGVEAVIDKDATSALMADLLDVDMFLILTAIDYVMINFGKENQEALKNVKVSQLREYIKEDQFHKGSMLPKIEAAIDFVGEKDKRLCIITELDNVLDAIDGKIGTKILA